MGILESLLGAGASLLGGVLGLKGQEDTNQANLEAVEKTNETNLSIARETNAQNLALTHEQWGRDDNAVQRRTADLKAAGLNPVLAAGGAAGNSAAIPMRGTQMEAPKYENSVGAGLAAASAVTDMQAKLASVATTKAQAELLKRQAEGVDVDNKLKLGTLQAKTDQAIADAKVAVESAGFRVFQAQYAAQKEQFDSLISQAEYRVRQEKITAAVYDNLMASIDLKIRENELTESQGKAVQAVAVGKLAHMTADFYEKLGLSKDAVQLLTQALKAVVGVAGAALIP